MSRHQEGIRPYQHMQGDKMLEGIRTRVLKADSEGNYTDVRFHFGPHYFVELRRTESNRVTFKLGATHHGFEADASDIGGDLERIIDLVREHEPQLIVD